MSTVGIALAAGFGKRLLSLTDNCPKPLIMIAGVETLFLTLYKFDYLGIRHVIVNAHYLHKQIAEAIKSWNKYFPNLEIRCQIELPEILNCGGGIINIVKNNSDWCKDSALLIHNSDTISHFDLHKLISKEKNNFAVSYRKDFLQKYNPVWVDENNHYAGIVPKPGLHSAHFLGSYFLNYRSVAQIASEKYHIRNINLFDGILQPLTDSGLPISAISFVKENSDNEYWYDITSVDYIEEAGEFLLSKDNRSDLWKNARELRSKTL